VGFQQLHYTSCQDGPAGYSGFQFSAITPGIPPAVMREVEDLTVYQPPPSLVVSPCPETPDVYPVALSHAASAATGAAITAHVVFAGSDYSGRPGNYFAHALVTANPERDFGPVLPAELWGADLWQRHPADGAELPELPGPPPRGIIDPPGVQAFLDAHGMGGVLGELLTAVNHAMAGAQPVLLACHDATESAWWIAAVSYLLGERLGRQMTFTTYTHRPGSAHFHLVGILADALPADAVTGFQLFDLTSGLTPGGDVDPLAGLLADTGVIAAPALWRQAAPFASGAERSFDDWLPAVAVAAALLGRPVASAEREAMSRWIGGAITRLPPDIADVALGVVLAEPDGALAGDRLIELLGLARQAAPARVAHIEDLLIERAVGQIGSGGRVAAVGLTSRGTSAASERAARLLDTASAQIALAVLDWAGAWDLSLPEERLEQYGQSCLGDDPPAPELVELLRRSPAVLRGMLTSLDSGPPQVADAVLGGPAGAAIQRDDLDGYPSLAEAWILRSAAHGSVAPLRALDEIADIRARAGRTSRIDLALLSRLWPAGCPPDQLAELLGLIADDLPADAVTWLAAQVSIAAAYGEPDDAWYRLAEVAAGSPIRDALPGQDLQIMRNAARAGPLLTLAHAGNGDAGLFAKLFALHQTANDGRVRGLLERELPALLAGAAPLGPALRGCPEGVALGFRAELESRLAAPEADIALAARVFTALADPGVATQPILVGQLAAAVGPARAWRRRDLDALGHLLEGESQAGQQFEAWRGSIRRARFWRWPP
jgi:GTPase-associated protein 1, N-terminal domain type 2/GTPase-associated protein 1, middle domain/GTPase-associated protein 1, C-terminal domain